MLQFLMDEFTKTSGGATTNATLTAANYPGYTSTSDTSTSGTGSGVQLA